MPSEHRKCRRIVPYEYIPIQWETLEEVILALKLADQGSFNIPDLKDATLSFDIKFRNNSEAVGRQGDYLVRRTPNDAWTVVKSDAFKSTYYMLPCEACFLLDEAKGILGRIPQSPGAAINPDLLARINSFLGRQDLPTVTPAVTIKVESAVEGR